MKKEYKVFETPFGNSVITYEENGFLYSIPADPSNSDYQAYLKRDEPQVEHLTEIPPQAALSTPIVSSDE